MKYEKQCDWLSHARPALFPIPLFLFPAKKKHQNVYLRKKLDFKRKKEIVIKYLLNNLLVTCTSWFAAK